MTTSISSQNTIFVISTIVIISTISMLIAIEKEYKKILNIFFDFELSKNSIIFINHIFYRNKFKRLKHFSSFFIN